MKANSSECNICNKTCGSRPSVKCSSCLKWQHTRCTKLTTMQISLYLNPNTSYICSKCLIDILPFQQVCDVEFKEMFYQNIFKQITSTLNNEPNLDDLIKPNCKYRGVEWYKKCLTNSKNQNGLSIIHFNVRSIVKNKHILEELIHELDNFPDVITISETKLNKNNINHASIQNYKFVFSNSTTNAGGVAMYILNNLKYSRRHDLEFQSVDSETVFIELNLAANKKIIVGVIYRHPTNTFNEFQDLLLQTLNKMDLEKYDYFLCGDFNIDILKHESKKI